MDADVKWLTNGTMLSGSRLLAVTVPQPNFDGVDVTDVKYVKRQRRMIVRCNVRSSGNRIVERRTYSPSGGEYRSVSMLSESVMEVPIKIDVDNWFGRYDSVENLRSLVLGCFIPLRISRCSWYAAGAAPVISRYGKDWYIPNIKTRMFSNVTYDVMYAARESLRRIVYESEHAPEEYAQLVRNERSSFNSKESAVMSLVTAANNYSDYDGVYVDKGLEKGLIKPNDVTWTRVMNSCRRDMCGYNIGLSFVDVVGYDDFMAGKYDYSRIETGAEPEEILGRVEGAACTPLKLNGQEQLQLLKCRVSARTPSVYDKELGDTEWKSLKEANVL